MRNHVARFEQTKSNDCPVEQAKELIAAGQSGPSIKLQLKDLVDAVTYRKFRRWYDEFFEMELSSHILDEAGRLCGFPGQSAADTHIVEFQRPITFSAAQYASRWRRRLDDAKICPKCHSALLQRVEAVWQKSSASGGKPAA